MAHFLKTNIALIQNWLEWQGNQNWTNWQGNKMFAWMAGQKIGLKWDHKGALRRQKVIFLSIDHKNELR